MELQLKGINIAFKVQILDKKMVIKNKLGVQGERNMVTQDFNKHRVTCKRFSLQAMMRKEKMNYHKVKMKVMTKVVLTKAKCLNIKNAILIASSKQK